MNACAQVVTSGSTNAAGVYLTEVPELDDERAVAESSDNLNGSQKRESFKKAVVPAPNRLVGWAASSGRPRIVVDNSASGQQAIDAKLPTGTNKAGKSLLPASLRGVTAPHSTQAAWAGRSSALTKNQSGAGLLHRQSHRSRSNSSGSTLPSLGHSGLRSRV